MKNLILDYKNSKEGDLNKKDGLNCDLCKNKGLIYTIDDFDYESVKICECMKKRSILLEIKKSGLEEQFKKNTFENYIITYDWQLKILNAAKKYIDEIITNKKKHWLVLSGAVGSGKTHICVAVSLKLIESGLSFKYLSFAREMPRLQSRLRSVLIDVKDKAEADFEVLLNVDVLYIDDYLKIKDMRNIFELIDARYFKNKITIISSELSYDEQFNLDEAIASRIYEKTCGFWYSIKKERNKNMRLNDVNEV